MTLPVLETVPERDTVPVNDIDVVGVAERHCVDDGVPDIIADVEIVPVVDTEVHTEDEGVSVPDGERVLEIVGDTVLVSVAAGVCDVHVVTDPVLHIVIVAEPELELAPVCVTVVERVSVPEGLVDEEPEREKIEAVAHVVIVSDELALDEKERPENVAETLGLALDEEADDTVTDAVNEWLGEPDELLGAESVGDNDGDVVIE